MLQNIRIDGFRGIKHVELNNLRNVNVLIGENNSGKTSILEAVQLFANDNTMANLYSIAYKREVMLPVLGNRSAMTDMLLYCFHEGQHRHIRVEADTCFQQQIYVDIKGERFGYIEEDQKGWKALVEGEKTGIRGRYEYSVQGVHRDEEFEVVESNRMLLRSSKGVIPMEYLNPATAQTQHTSIKTMYNVMRSEEREALITLLRKFDSRIVGIDKAVRSGRAINFLEMQDGEMRPVSVFGDGVKKVLAIANALVKSRGGILLIDEFETGIHKNALRKVAVWLFEAARKNETQVFLTTHSGEAIDVLTEESAYWGDLNLYRLEQYEGTTYVKKFAGEDVNSYRNNWGMDLF